MGYVVLSTRVEDGLKKGIIVDLLTYPNLTAILKCLTSRAIQHFKETGVSYVECWVFKSNPFHMSLIKQGFFPVPTFLLGADLVARVDSSKVSEAFIKDSMNWYTTQGDYY